jgi:DNA-binding FadR family transcriptional regulator
VEVHALDRAAHNSALLIMFLATQSLLAEAFDTLHASQPDMAGVARRVHTELYHAIARHDAEKAVRLMREHLYEFAARAERAQVAAARRRKRGGQ